MEDAVSKEDHDKWFRAKVQEALGDGDGDTISHEEAMKRLREEK